MASSIPYCREIDLWLRGGGQWCVGVLGRRRSLASTEFLKLEWAFAVFLRFQNLLAVISIEIFVRNELEEEIGYIN
jgi:hypothetical protein